jgi:hypothetical protein
LEDRSQSASTISRYSRFVNVLTARSDDMASFFEPCANKIVELIQGQLEQVEGLGTRPKVVSLLKPWLSFNRIANLRDRMYSLLAVLPNQSIFNNRSESL